MAPNRTIFSKENFSDMIEIGTGSFGITYKARLKMEKQSRPVAVKVINEQFEFYTQKARLNELDHPNVLKLLGFVFPNNRTEESDGKGLPWLIIEYLRSNLKDYLTTTDCSEKTLFSIGYEVAKGMDYLHDHKQGFVHKDVAARNVVISLSLEVKIAHHDICNTYHKGDYAHDDAGSLVPIRWMPPENLPMNGASAAFTREGDVFSYGVTLFEIWSKCSRPYGSKMGDKEIMNEIKNGKTPLTFTDVVIPSNGILELIESSCSFDPKTRPTFTQITSQLEEMQPAICG